MGEENSGDCNLKKIPEGPRQLVRWLSRSINGSLRCDLEAVCIRTSWTKVWDLKPASQAVNPDSTDPVPACFSLSFL